MMTQLVCDLQTLGAVPRRVFGDKICSAGDMAITDVPNVELTDKWLELAFGFTAAYECLGI